MNKKLMIIGFAVLFFSNIICGCNESKQNGNPEGVIVNEYTTSNLNLENFIIYVNLTVKNIGEAGRLEVQAYVRQGLIEDSKSQDLFFDGNEIKNVSFAFSDKFKLGSSWFHDCSVNNLN